MSKVTLISHFYNEELLLPFWIAHHEGMFDDVIMINHKSTDRSVEIIRELAPNWRIVDSKLDKFDPYYTDFEVQKIEDEICDGWKICLNTTEFLVGPLKQIIGELEKTDQIAIYTSAKIMIDRFPDQDLISGVPLIRQKPYGAMDSKLYDLIFRGPFARKLLKLLIKPKSRNIGRQRLLHKSRTGQYLVGRHQWGLQARSEPRLCVFWYGFSPWTRTFVDRKLGIAEKIPENHNGLGFHHLIGKSKLQKKFKMHFFYLVVISFLTGRKM